MKIIFGIFPPHDLRSSASPARIEFRSLNVREQEWQDKFTKDYNLYLREFPCPPFDDVKIKLTEAQGWQNKLFAKQNHQAEHRSKIMDIFYKLFLTKYGKRENHISF